MNRFAINLLFVEFFIVGNANIESESIMSYQILNSSSVLQFLGITDINSMDVIVCIKQWWRGVLIETCIRSYFQF